MGCIIPIFYPCASFFFSRSSPKTDRSSGIETGDDRAIIDPVAVVTGVAMITIDVSRRAKKDGGGWAMEEFCL